MPPSRMTGSSAAQMPFLKASQNSAQIERLRRHLPVEPDRVSGQHEREQDAGAEACGEQVGHAGLRHQRVDDHRDRRRDDDAERAARHDRAERELQVVAGLAHRRVHHRADGQHRDDRRAGDRGECRARQDAGDRKATGQRLGQCGEDADQSLRDRAARHHVAAQDEQRDRQDHFLVEADPHVLDDEVELALSPFQVNDRGDRQQDDEQRLPQRQQREDRADDQDGGHSWNSGGCGRIEGQAAYMR